MDVRSLAGRWVAITGAASGIGRATARACAERGASLALCDLDAGALDGLAAELRAPEREVLVRRADVARDAELRDFAEAVHQRTPAVDLLVNNAGVALGAPFLDTPLEDWDWIVSINLRGVVNGCHFFVPAMVERGRGGHVVNVASVAGFLGSEAFPAYCATKHAVVGLSESLQEELARHRIGVTALCPGFVATDIVRRARVRGLADGTETRRLMAEMLERRGCPPERVARSLLRAVQRGRVLAPVTPEAWIAWTLKRLSPGLMRRIGALASRYSRRRLGIEDPPGS